MIGHGLAFEPPGRTILDQNEQAATRSVGGIFLFTKDDDFVDHGQPELAVRRDNVIFEAGISLHPCRNKNSIEPIERTLKAFVDAI
jgi:hypothetical protein